MRFSVGFLFLFASSFVRADFSTPAGIWDIQATAIIGGKARGGKMLVTPQKSAYAFVQFKGDRGYTTIPWLQVPGQWTSLRKNKRAYKVSFDLKAAGNGQTRPPFLNFMLNQYLGLVQKKYGQISTLKSLELKSYSDQGKLTKKGMQIEGTQRINANVTFVDPKSQRDVAASVRMVLAYRGTRASAPSECCSSDDAARNQADSDAFLAENAKIAGIKSTPSGLQYRILSEGNGKTPEAASTVTIDYRSILPSGQLFDSRSRVSFALNSVGLPQGLSEGLQLMREGAYYRLYLPPHLAFGAVGLGSVVKGNSALIFDVSLSAVSAN